MKIVATPLDYQELWAAVLARVAELNVPLEPLNSAMGLPSGYLGKVLGPAQRSRMGFDSQFKILETLGLRLVIVEHLDVSAAIEELGTHYRERGKTANGQGRLKAKLSPAVAEMAVRARAAQIAHLGGQARAKKLSACRRKQIARKGGKARWYRLGRN